MKRFFLLFPTLSLLALFTITGCDEPAEQSESASAELDTMAQADTAALDQQDFRKVDTHTHYEHDWDFLLPILRDWNMQAMTIEVIKKGHTGRERWNAMTQLHEAHPDTILLCVSFNAFNIDDPNFAQNTIAQLRRDIKQGAIAVKVWKNIGMVIKDDSGAYIQIDDERFEPIWDFLIEQDIPVVAHIGEPRAAWRPLDKKSPHYTYYKNHPQYHNYKNSDVPSWETIIAARDRWLESNPDLTVIGAHLGSMAYDVDEIAERLDEYPNFYVDTAERFGDLAIQPSDSVRSLFMQYPDRILYGTDLRAKTPASELSDKELQSKRDDLEKRLRVHWRYLTTPDSLQFVRTGTSFKTQARGINLPRDVIRQVYYDNAARLLDLPGEATTTSASASEEM